MINFITVPFSTARYCEEFAKIRESIRDYVGIVCFKI